jgi:hypothetical protein
MISAPLSSTREISIWMQFQLQTFAPTVSAILEILTFQSISETKSFHLRVSAIDYGFAPSVPFMYKVSPLFLSP